MSSRKSASVAPVRLTPDHSFFPIVEAAYEAFKSPVPSETGVCVRCCMDPQIEADFFNPPIRDLPLHYLQDWYSGAYDPHKEVPRSTWIYLLPRILEFLALGEDLAWVGEEVIFHRYRTGDPERWDAGQWEVLDTFRWLYLDRAIAGGGLPGYLDDSLCMLAAGGWAMEDLLAQLDQADDGVLAERLYRDWCPVPHKTGKIWITAFWESPNRSRAYAYYTSQALYDRMEALALSDDTDTQLAGKASAVAGVIEASME